MGKIYNQGIVSPKGFDLSAAEPVDQRSIVKYYTDLTTLAKCYPGIEVSIEELQYKKYKLIAIPSSLLSNWVVVESGVGPAGPEGPVGQDGADGESAYQLYVDNGGTLSETDWLLSLQGQDGQDGTNGIGVPLGGVTGQSLVKTSDTNYDTMWADISTGIPPFPISKSDYHQSLQIDIPFIETDVSWQLEAAADDPSLGGFHASIYVEEIGKYFVFTRSAATKVYVYDDINDFSSKSIIDISDASYAGGIESATYNKKAGKIFFSFFDSTYAQTNTLIKSIEVTTNIVSTVINYNTGINPGPCIVLSIEDFIYTAEGNYGFKFNKFDINGNFISSIANGMSGLVGAHGWAIDKDAFYVSSFINYNNQNWISKVDLATFTVVDSFDYNIPNANIGTGNNIFTNQLAINGQYIYLPIENFPQNYIYKVNKNNLSDFTIIDVLKTSILDNLYFAQSFGDKIYYGGANDTFGSIDVNTGENILLENPFPFSLNQVTVTRDQLLVAGFDVYPVNNTAYIGKGRYFKILGSNSSGGIGGSIVDNQIAVGAATTNEIEGSAGLTYDGSTLATTGNIALLKTTAQGIGEITKDGKSFIHDYTNNADLSPWYRNLFIGIEAGNFTNGDGTGGIGGLNIGIGHWTLQGLTTGMQNHMIGEESGFNITTGNSNIGLGDTVLYSLITGNNNIGIGKNVFQSLTNNSSDNIAIGRNAGFYAGIGAGTNLITGNRHILIGRQTSPSANSTNDEIVIGYQATGSGSNTMTLGGTNIIDTYIKGNVWGRNDQNTIAPTLNEFITWEYFNANASAGGSPLTTKGDLYTYSTTDDALQVGADGTVLMADSGEITGLSWNAFVARLDVIGGVQDFAESVGVGGDGGGGYLVFDSSGSGHTIQSSGVRLDVDLNSGADHFEFNALFNTGSSILTKAQGDILYSGGVSLPVVDTTSIVEGSVDATKQLRFEVDGLTTATTRVITMPDSDVDLGNVALLNVSNQFTGNSDLFNRVSVRDTNGDPSGFIRDFFGIFEISTDFSSTMRLKGTTIQAQSTLFDISGELTTFNQRLTGTSLEFERTIAEIDGYGVQSLVTKEWVQAQSTGDSLPVTDDISIVKGLADPTKEVKILTNIIATGQTRSIWMADEDIFLSAIPLNSIKVTNATHTGDVIGNEALTAQPALITGKTVVPALGDDYVLIADQSDSFNLKAALISDFLGGGDVYLANTQSFTGINTFLNVDIDIGGSLDLSDQVNLNFKDLLNVSKLSIDYSDVANASRISLNDTLQFQMNNRAIDFIQGFGNVTFDGDVFGRTDQTTVTPAIYEYLTKEYIDSSYTNVFLKTVASSGNYTTLGQNADSSKLVIQTGASAVHTLDKTGLTIGFQQQILNNSGGNITFASTDTIIGNINSVLADKESAYYALVSATEWELIVAGSEDPGINAQTGTSYTLVDSDRDKLVTLDNAAAITLTVSNTLSLPISAEINLLNKGVGQVTVAVSSATVNTSQTLKLRTQWSAATLKQISTDVWVLIGDLEAV